MLGSPRRVRLSPRRPARLATALASALLLIGTATACGSGDDADTGSDGAAPADGAFPVSIAHKYGSTTVKAEPKRIVTVGLTDQDAVLALGKVPVGTTEWLGGYKGAIGPWASDELGKAKAPTVLKDTGTGPQTEKIAALRPDLILAVYGGLTKEQYTTLSKFAPVVAQPKEYNDFGVPWQRQTETIGKALGQEAEAKKLVTGVEADFKTATKKNPAFAKSSAVMATPYEGIFAFGSQDPRSRVLTGLGFTLPGGLDKVIGDEFGANISKERTDLLDTDAIVWIASDPAKDEAKLDKNALYADLDVAKEDREVYVAESSDYGNSVSFVTVLSLPYMLDRLVPQLASAVDGDTATRVKPHAGNQ
ncbi:MULTISPECIES: iron-siderophore ABC transporter substrate-binding protein [unclassified Streptomyces]|uniref:iron-siderophore ABC transporter substrate-binding protein n=1 Tax=unclassified Streptomyces TaxID=2593676 RepID=UPI003318E091